MPTRYTPDRRTIGNILSMTNPPVVVPDWQRDFSWTTSEVETFWQDLCRFNERYPDDNVNDQEYFLGAVVIVDTNQGHLLLDGQQRIATSAILISVIRDFLAKYRKDAATRASVRYLTDFDDALEDYTYKVTLNRFDKDFFKREILENREPGYELPTPLYESHNLIRKARNFLYGKFNDKYAESQDPVASYKWTLRILKILTNHISVVAVISDDEDNASNVFETLNDRGIGLSTPDLLRNLILRRANTAHLDEILALWGEVLEIEGGPKIKDFFRHFWLSYEGDVKARSLYREVKAKITERGTDSLEFSRSLCNSSRTYQDILSANYEGNDRIVGLLEGINALGAKVLYPPILSLLETTDDNGIIKSYLWAFIVTYVRHTLICKKENSQIENIMFSIAKRIRTALNGELRQELIEFAPNDEQFKDAFISVSIPRQASARYVLREIEHHLRTTEELEVATPSRVHVEHIYPRTPQPDNQWPQHQAFVNRLGNLTLLSARLNVTIKNSAYGEKKPYYEDSELIITKRIASSFDEWNVEAINSRQSELTDNALKIWKY